MKRPGILVAPFLAILLLSILTPMVSIDSQASSGKPTESMLIDVRLDGADLIGAGMEETFTLRISYAYPERILNFSYLAEMTGANTTGGSVTPKNATSGEGVFEVDIRGPMTPGKITVKVNATATEASNTWYRVKEFEIDIVKPIYIEAKLVNNGDVAVNGVSVKMLVDGKLMQTEKYNLTGKQTIDLNFSWVAASIVEGKHTVTLMIDDPTNIIDFSSGDNVLTLDVYYSKSGDILRGVLVLMIIFMAVILILTFLQKKGGSKRTK